MLAAHVNVVCALWTAGAGIGGEAGRGALDVVALATVLPIHVPCVVVSFFTNVAVPDAGSNGSKNRPLTTALPPARLVTLICTCPLTAHCR